MKSLMPFIIIGICVGLYFLNISPALSDIQAKNAKYDEYQNVLNQVERIKNIRENLTAEYDSISSQDLEKLNKIIPEKFNSENFANDLNYMALQNNLKIKAININLPSIENQIIDASTGLADTNQYQKITASFEITGRYDQLISFMKTVETSLRLIDITNLNIRPGGDEKNNQSLTYALQVTTYSLK